ncbi:MAG: YigZ family protein [Hydrogenibacillus schlegelii]|nr:YigZ family protein [Hydrogenibacillus schlegelii]
MTPYVTLAGPGTAEWTVERSRFIAYARPAESEAEAREFIQSIRKKHWDATHNVSAYVVGVTHRIQHADDDGEPAGTAGRPVLEALLAREVTNAVVVVTRYFGGIKLGAGGLVRAYRKSAHLGLRAAGLIRRRPAERYRLTLSYADVEAVQAVLARAGFRPADVAYLDVVGLVFAVLPDETEAFFSAVAAATRGRGRAAFDGTTWLDEPIVPADDEG